MGQFVLVVDDNEEARALLRILLRRKGIKVFEAADGVEGLEKLLEHKPNLVLLDLDMPRMDGFEFLEKRHTVEAEQQTPVVVVSAREDDESRERCPALGAIDFFLKGPNLSERLAPCIPRWIDQPA